MLAVLMSRLLVQAVFVSRALHGLSIGSPAVLLSEPADRWDAVGELLNAYSETAVAEANQESEHRRTEVAQVPANRRLTFAAIDAADAESSRRVKAPPYAQLAVQLAASPVDVGTD